MDEQADNTVYVCTGGGRVETQYIVRCPICLLPEISAAMVIIKEGPVCADCADALRDLIAAHRKSERVA